MAKSNFWTKLKNISSNVVNWFKSILTKNDEVYRRYAPLAINIVNSIKTFNDSPEADIIEAISSKLLGKYGSVALLVIATVRGWMKGHLVEVLDGMKLGEAVANAQTVEAKAIAAQNYIKALGVKESTYKWTELASKIADALTDGRFSVSEIAAIIICVYNTNANDSNTI